ncbi:MAG: diguanylate cyclase [Gammaproteobacteria bacterium]|nr:diguanylate cyclase [Gammaproteobacteria bacterium]
MSISGDLAETWLNSCPCGALSLDDQGKIQYLNPALEKMLDISAAQLVGLSPSSACPPLPKGLFEASGLLQLTGPEAGRERWLDCSVHPSGPGRAAIHFFVDVTELVTLRRDRLKLQQQVEDLTITDELTGLANQRALNRALSAQVTRSRRYQNPLSLALLEITETNGTQADLSDDTILAASRFLRDRFRWVDVIARWDNNHFVIILPETNHEQAVDLISGISRGFGELELNDLGHHHPLVLRYGIAQWLKGNDTRILMERAAESLTSFGLGTQSALIN